MLGADIVLALAAGGQVKDDLLVQGKVGQRFLLDNADITTVMDPEKE